MTLHGAGAVRSGPVSQLPSKPGAFTSATTMAPERRCSGLEPNFASPVGAPPAVMLPMEMNSRPSGPKSSELGA